MILFIFLSLFSAAEICLPEWQPTGNERIYSDDNLYGYINGGAELFKEFGFKTLTVQHYKIDSLEITMNIYEMNSDTSALGIYLSKCGTENPWPDITIRHTVNPYQVTAVNDKYFMQIDNFSGDAKGLKAISEFIKSCDKDKPPGKDQFFLSDSLMIANSERLIRGPYALQPIYTFGEGDVFNLGGKIFAQYARYKNDTEWSLLVIPYPNEQQARQAFSNVCSKLDPYLSVIERSLNLLIFKDYKDEYGKIEIQGHQLTVKFRLSTPP